MSSGGHNVPAGSQPVPFQRALSRSALSDFLSQQRQASPEVTAPEPSRCSTPSEADSEVSLGFTNGFVESSDAEEEVASLEEPEQIAPAPHSYGVSLQTSPWHYLVRARSPESQGIQSLRSGSFVGRYGSLGQSRYSDNLPEVERKKIQPGVPPTSLTAPLLPIPGSLPEDHHRLIQRDSLDLTSDVKEQLPPLMVPKQEPKKGLHLNNLLFGIINAVVGIPTMISFAAIVYQDPYYHKYLPELARFSFLSAATHQVVFTFRSSLPFAVGQPQDVGLIFLSAMATDIADRSVAGSLSSAQVIGTTLATITIATLLVGVLTVCVGRFKLATLVQYVPLPVVGGYLGYVGYFCLAAGMGLGVDLELNTFKSWTKLIDRGPLLRAVPTLLSTLTIMVTMRRARSPWALPLVLMIIPAVFHVVLYSAGFTLQQAIDTDWCFRPPPGGQQNFWDLYRLFELPGGWLSGGPQVAALLAQVPKMVALFFVVAFGSSLDVAAIQADIPEPVDFNRELETVGWSNVVVGLTGSGYTGSYIFSQTIFSLRNGVSSRLHGIVIALLELLVFLLPFSVIQYLPKFFFGSLLTVFGIEIASDWLVRSYQKVTLAEYLLLLGTFLAIMQSNLEAGIGIGIMLSVLYFAYSYAQVHLTAFTVVPSRSDVVRSRAEKVVLEKFNHHMMAVSLSGYIFFGSSQSISAKVLQLVGSVLEEDRQGQKLAEDEDPMVSRKSSQLSVLHGGGLTGHLTYRHPPPPGAMGLDPSQLDPKSPPIPYASYKSALPGIEDDSWLVSAVAEAPYFVLLDFRRVRGLDATAAQTFATLRNSLERLGVELLLTHMTNPTMERLLAAHGVITPVGHASAGEGKVPGCRAFADTDSAAQYCEERFLALARRALRKLLRSYQEHLGQGLQSRTSGLAVQRAAPNSLRPRQGMPSPSPSDVSTSGLTNLSTSATMHTATSSPSGHVQTPAPASRVAGVAGNGLHAPERRCLEAADISRLRGLLMSHQTMVEHELSVAEVLQYHMQMSHPLVMLPSGIELAQVADKLSSHGQIMELTLGQLLFDYDDPSTHMYIILKGEVGMQVKPITWGNQSAIPADMLPAHHGRVFRNRPGMIVGSTDFVLQRPRHFRASCLHEGKVLAIDSNGLSALAADSLAAVNVLQAILLRDALAAELDTLEYLQISESNM